MSGVRNRLVAMSKSVAAMGKDLLMFGAAAAAPLALAVKNAADLEEVMNKFNVVFGDNAEAMKRWGDDFAAEIGRSKRQIAEFLAGGQDLFIPLGFDEAAATEMSQRITQLAVDLASFNNMADEDAMRDLQAALTGSGEVMKKYGVIVSEAAVKQQLLNEGIDPARATDQQKVMARLTIIMKGTTAAQGDALRSLGSFTNQMKAARAAGEDLGAAVGTAILPVITPLVTDLAALARGTSDWVTKNRDLVVTLSKLIGVIVATGAAMFVLSKVLGGLATTIAHVTMLARGFGAVMAFLAANPAVFAITALVGALFAARMAFDRVGTAASKYAQSMREVREEGDRLREQERGQAERLTRLSEQEELSNREKADALKLIAELETKYGDLGIAIDDTTGKITGLEEGLKRLNDQQRAGALSQIDEELDAKEAEMRRLLKLVQTGSDNLMDGAPRLKGGELFAENPGEASLLHRINGWKEAVKELRLEMAALHARRDALFAGDDAALTGELPPRAPGTGDGNDPVQVEKDIVEWQRRAHDLRLKMIDDEMDRREAEIEARYRREIEQAKGNDQLIRAIEAARAQELMNLDKERLERAAEQRVQLADEQARREAEAAMELQREQERIADANKSRAETIEELELRSRYKGIELERALLDLQEKRAIEAAKAAGENLELVHREFALKRQALEASMAVRSSLRSAGTMSSRVEQVLGGQLRTINRDDQSDRAIQKTIKDLEEKQKEAQEQIVVFVQEIVSSLREGGAVFG